jgi:plasmid stabilization system protein ParE
MKVIWSKESIDRLNEIREFIARNNPVNADEFIRFLVGKMKIIEDNPILKAID